MVGSAWAFPQLSANSDEGIYLLQADTLLAGNLSPAAPAADGAAFRPWFALQDGGRYVLKYTPVHAGVLALGSLLPGPERVALGLIAAAQVGAVAAFAAELGARRRARVLAAAIFAVSPLTLLLDTTFLPYGTSLALGLGASTLALRAARTGSRRSAALAGLVWGVALFARPYDAVLIALALAVAVAARVGRRGARSALGLLVPATLGALGPIALLLAFNGAVTGDPLQLPFNVIEDADRLGFGDRRALPTDPYIRFGPGEAVAALGRNLLLVVAWTGGGLVALVLGGLAVRRPAIEWTPLAALLVVWPLGYVLFWGSYMTAFVWDGALFLGPYYYLPMVAAVSIAAGAGLDDLVDRSRPAAGLALVGVVGLVVVVIAPAIGEQRDRSAARVELAAALDAAVDDPALVFLPPVYGPYLQNPFSFLRNTPRLDGDRVYALTRSAPADEALWRRHPERNVYEVRLPRGWSDQPGFEPDIEIERIRAAGG